MCPASLAADIDAEPLPPAGVDPSMLPPELTRFLFGEWLPWARGNTQRLDRARSWCAEKAARWRPKIRAKAPMASRPPSAGPTYDN